MFRLHFDLCSQKDALALDLDRGACAFSYHDRG